MRVFGVAVAILLAATTASAQSNKNERRGGWIGIGAGVGNAGAHCDQCGGERSWGFAGSIRAGGTVTQNLLIGFETNGFIGSNDSTDDNRLGFASVTATLFPSQRSNFYLKIGLGGMSYFAQKGVDELTAVAPSLLFGIGYEVLIGRSTCVVPYVNYLTSTSVDVSVNGQPVPTSSIDVNLIQLGVGLLWR